MLDRPVGMANGERRVLRGRIFQPENQRQIALQQGVGHRRRLGGQVAGEAVEPDRIRLAVQGENFVAAPEGRVSGLVIFDPASPVADADIHQ